MTSKPDENDAGSLAHQRLHEFLELLRQQGLTQQQIASKARLPVQYLSDIKNNRRPLTELAARRLADEYEINYQWLLGISDSMENPRPRPAATGKLWLPLLPFPIEGEPRANPNWDGTGVEIAGAAAAKLALAQQPYILRFGHNDVRGRLRKGDLILISQTPSAQAEISVVKHRKKLFLARRNEDGSWERAANGQTLPVGSPIAGCCLGVVWSSLCSDR